MAKPKQKRVEVAKDALELAKKNLGKSLRDAVAKHAKQKIQGVKKAHVQGRSVSSLRGKELHDRAINPLMNGAFVLNVQPPYNPRTKDLSLCRPHP